jgi:hypothetical protein
VPTRTGGQKVGGISRTGSRRDSRKGWKSGGSPDTPCASATATTRSSALDTLTLHHSPPKALCVSVMATTHWSLLIGTFLARVLPHSAYFPTSALYTIRLRGGLCSLCPPPLTSTASGAYSPDHVARLRSSCLTIACCTPTSLPQPRNDMQSRTGCSSPLHPHPHDHPFV